MKNQISDFNSKFHTFLESINIKESALIGTNQIISGDLSQKYPDLKNIVSVNFQNCIGLFCYSDNNFLFVHSDPLNSDSLPDIVNKFHEENKIEDANILCIFNKTRSIFSSYDDLIKTLNNQHKNLDIIVVEHPNNKVSKFDLFIDVLPLRSNEKPIYHYLKFLNEDQSVNIAYLDDEKNLMKIDTDYLKIFIEEVSNKNPEMVKDGFVTTYLGGKGIKNISDFDKKIDNKPKQGLDLETYYYALKVASSLEEKSPNKGLISGMIIKYDLVKKNLTGKFDKIATKINYELKSKNLETDLVKYLEEMRDENVLLKFQEVIKSQNLLDQDYPTQAEYNKMKEVKEEIFFKPFKPIFQDQKHDLEPKKSIQLKPYKPDNFSIQEVKEINFKKLDSDLESETEVKR